MRRRTLCQTLAGNSCDLLTITQPPPDLSEQASSPTKAAKKKKRKGSGSERKSPKASRWGGPGIPPLASECMSSGRRSGKSAAEIPLAERQHVVISARVHPGESNASWMMQGVLDFLTGSSSDAQQLRRVMMFHVIPMLNPDGVINGNYRCSLAGVDLNRKWGKPHKYWHPPVFAAKNLIRRLQERGKSGGGGGGGGKKSTDRKGKSGEAGDGGGGSKKKDGETKSGDKSWLEDGNSNVFAFIDLHGPSNVFIGCAALLYTAAVAWLLIVCTAARPGYIFTGHSRKKNVFMYGCANIIKDARIRSRAKTLPLLLSDKSPIFSLECCDFDVQRSKRGTARVVGFTQLHARRSSAEHPDLQRKRKRCVAHYGLDSHCCSVLCDSPHDRWSIPLHSNPLFAAQTWGPRRASSSASRITSAWAAISVDLSWDSGK